MNIINWLSAALEAVIKNIEDSDVEYVKKPGKPAEFRIRFNNNGQPPIEGSIRPMARLKNHRGDDE